MKRRSAEERLLDKFWPRGREGHADDNSSERRTAARLLREVKRECANSAAAAYWTSGPGATKEVVRGRIIAAIMEKGGKRRD